MGKTLEDLMTECEESARAEGWEGEWEPTAQDLEWVTDKLGRKPTRVEWADVGLRWVGGAHVGEE